MIPLIINSLPFGSRSFVPSTLKPSSDAVTGFDSDDSSAETAEVVTDDSSVESTEVVSDDSSEDITEFISDDDSCDELTLSVSGFAVEDALSAQPAANSIIDVQSKIAVPFFISFLLISV